MIAIAVLSGAVFFVAYWSVVCWLIRTVFLPRERARIMSEYGLSEDRANELMDQAHYGWPIPKSWIS